MVNVSLQLRVKNKPVNAAGTNEGFIAIKCTLRMSKWLDITGRHANASLLALPCVPQMPLVERRPQRRVGTPGHTTASGENLIPAASAPEFLRTRPRCILETLCPLPSGEPESDSLCMHFAIYKSSLILCGQLTRLFPWFLV